jgi:hypothetical protein
MLIINTANKILDEIDSLDEMKNYLYDKDLDGRDCLTFIWEHDIRDFMVNPLVAKLVHEIWDSPYKVSGTLFNASSLHEMTFFWRHNKTDIESDRRFYKLP